MQYLLPGYPRGLSHSNLISLLVISLTPIPRTTSEMKDQRTHRTCHQGDPENMSSRGSIEHVVDNDVNVYKVTSLPKM